MTREDFIQNIVDEITISGSLNVTVKTKEIERIIDNEKRNVFRNWRDTVELRYGIIPVTQFRTPEFRKSRTIQFPDCVWGIEEFREIRDGSRLFGINDPDLSMERVMGSDLWLSPFSSDVITTRTVSYSWFDLARSFTLKDIQFHFNLNTKRVQVIGHEPLAPVLCRVYVQIEDAALYDDYMFLKQCIGKTMVQIHRVLKTFEVTLVGGVSIGTYFMDLGKQYLDEVKEYINGQQNPDWFLMFQ